MLNNSPYIILYSCLEYMETLVDLLADHPEVELDTSVRDDAENYTVSGWVGLSKPSPW